jgi:hypothetical protein
MINETDLLDRARLTAQELGEVVRAHVPKECVLPMLEALIDHLGTKEHSSVDRLFRTFEAGLVAGLTGRSAGKESGPIDVDRMDL